MTGLMLRMTRCACRVVAALLLAAGGAAAEEAVLLASTAPGYTPGAVVAGSERLVFPDGASVALLFRSGQILRLRGPFDGTLDGLRPDRDGAAALAEAFRLRGVDASVIGATRSAGTARSRAQEVQVDADRSGTYCVGPSDTVWLLRANAESGDVALRRRRSLRTVGWPPGAERIEWPDDLPIEDGDRFEVLVDGKPVATLTFRSVTATEAPEAAAIAEGVLLGCHEQQESALRRLARVAMPPELWLFTDRGRRPSYQSGEPVVLSAIASTEGWLTCVVARQDGTVFPLGAAGTRLPAAMPIAFRPERNHHDGAFRAGPRGTELIRCWLSDRDITQELPRAFLNPPGAALPDSLAADLDAVFGRVSGSRMTTASLAIRIE